jgi:hypothetical protein
MNALRRLAHLGLLREGRRRGRPAFFADRVIQLLGPEGDRASVQPAGVS